jgi:hypothetical protein
MLRKLICGLFLVGALALSASAQTQLVEITKPLVSSHGLLVVDPNGAPISAALVNVESTNRKKLLRQRHTNARGYIGFSPGIYFLRVQGRGFNEYEIKLVVRKKARLWAEREIWPAT